MNVDPSGPALDLEVPLELIIGTIPLRQAITQYPAPAAAPSIQPFAGFAPDPNAMYPPTGAGDFAPVPVTPPPAAFPSMPNLRE